MDSNSPYMPIIGAEFPAKLLPLISGAKHSIKVMMFDWRFYPTQPTHPISKLTSALVAAKNKGVEVQLILSSDTVVKQMQLLGLDAVRLFGSRLIHAKVWIFDEKYAVIGSHNFTQSAMLDNVEVSVGVPLLSPLDPFNVYFSNLWPLKS